MTNFLDNFFSLHTLLTAIVFAISITLHEFAHAWMADHLGDPTPRSQGRVTPNPTAHIDPLGFLFIFLIGFGRGRPVLYNPYYLRNPLQDELKIALAWPAMNILLTIMGLLLLIVGNNVLSWGYPLLISTFLTLFCYMNIALAVFNMIPLPPLDGYRVIKVFAPQLMMRLEQYSNYILIGFLLIFIRGPWSGLLSHYIATVSEFIFWLLLMGVSSILGLMM